MGKVILRALVLLCFTLSAASSSAKEWSRVRIATEGAYPPWNQTDSSGRLTGFEVDLARAFCTRMRARCEIVAQAWDGIIPALQSGKYDAIMAGMAITAQREKAISFSECYAATGISFATLSDHRLAAYRSPLESINLSEISPEEQRAIDSLREALRGSAVGAQVATTLASFLETYMADAVDVRTYDTQENLELDLLARRIDAGLAGLPSWRTLAGTPAGSNVRLVGPSMRGGLFGRGVGVGIRKSDPDLRQMFNQAIAAADEDGTTASLARKWFGFEQPCS
jgi:octopine/nopaline transport system substrate-binding protein